MFRHSLLISTALASGVAGAASAAEPLASPPQFALPAVDGVNVKGDLFFGASRERTLLGTATPPVGGAAGSFTMPLGHSFGLQVDGVAASKDGEPVVGGAAHLFWRRPDLGLFGLYGSAKSFDAQDVTRVRAGAEGEVYAGRFTLSGVAGYERTNAPAATVGAIPGFNILDLGGRTNFFAMANASFYAHDNWKLTAGYRYIAGIHAGALGTEYMFRSNAGAAYSVFLEGRAGENRYAAVWGGLRVYFGQRDKTLIRRHREDDPANWLMEDVYGPRGVRQGSQAIKPPPVCSCGPCYPD